MKFGIHLPPFFGPAQVTSHRISSGHWRLRIETATFSGDKRCHLDDRKHGVTYAAGALGFHFDAHLNTLGAWVKIGDGPATRWQDALPELTRLGVPMEAEGLDNPTDGIVWVPALQLGATSRITVQPDERKRPVTYSLEAFAKLRDAARAMGCVPEQRFVR